MITALDDTEPDLRVATAKTLHTIVAAMTLDNFLVRPHRKWVERYAKWDSWTALTPEAATEVAEHLAGLPSTIKDDDEDAKRFDLLILRRQLAQLEGDAVAAERIREQVQSIAMGLLSQLSIPTVKAQEVLLDEIAGGEWWVDVSLPMLELARLRLRGLLRFWRRSRRRRSTPTSRTPSVNRP